MLSKYYRWFRCIQQIRVISIIECSMLQTQKIWDHPVKSDFIFVFGVTHTKWSNNPNRTEILCVLHKNDIFQKTSGHNLFDIDYLPPTYSKSV